MRWKELIKGYLKRNFNISNSSYTLLDIYSLVRGACPVRDFGKLPTSQHHIFEGVIY